MGFKVVATRGTKRFLEANGIQCDAINKVLEGRPHIVDAIKNGDIQLVFNTTEGSKALSDSKGHPAHGLASPHPLLYNIGGGGSGYTGH